MYTHQKLIPEKSESGVALDTQIVPKNEIGSKNSEQTGFGFKKEERKNEESSSDDDDIDKSSSKIVNDEVLKAFQSPVIRTAVENFEPPTKKFKSETNKTVKKFQNNRLKFI
jgi:hypothetical protein